MGKKFKCYLGEIELTSEILEVGIFEEFIQVECEDG